MFDELIHQVMEQWSSVTLTFFAGVGAAKVLSILIPLIPASYGVFIKWRTSGYRLVDRLDEFIHSQDERLKATRAKLSSLVIIPEPEEVLGRPAFSSRSLSRALRKMNWGFGLAATNNLADAARLSADQAKLSDKLSRQHQQREALANLLLGAKAASRQIADSHERNASRSEALEFFDKALSINAKDSEALEYSGMMLLELNEPAVALQRFESLADHRKSDGKSLDLARSYRLQAIALERQVPRRNTAVYEVLSRAADALSSECTIEHARVYEHLAIAAERLAYTIKYAQNLQRAWSFYHSLRNSAEGKKGLERISARLAALNMSAADSDSRLSGLASTTGVPPVLPRGPGFLKALRSNG